VGRLGYDKEPTSNNFLYNASFERDVIRKQEYYHQNNSLVEGNSFVDNWVVGSVHGCQEAKCVRVSDSPYAVSPMSLEIYHTGKGRQEDTIHVQQRIPLSKFKLNTTYSVGCISRKTGDNHPVGRIAVFIQTTENHYGLSFGMTSLQPFSNSYNATYTTFTTPANVVGGGPPVVIISFYFFCDITSTDKILIDNFFYYKGQGLAKYIPNLIDAQSEVFEIPEVDIYEPITSVDLSTDPSIIPGDGTGHTFNEDLGNLEELIEEEIGSDIVRKSGAGFRLGGGGSQSRKSSCSEEYIKFILKLKRKWLKIKVEFLRNEKKPEWFNQLATDTEFILFKREKLLECYKKEKSSFKKSIMKWALDHMAGFQKAYEYFSKTRIDDYTDGAIQTTIAEKQASKHKEISEKAL